MDRSAIFDPLGLEQFLFQATQSTSLTSPSVVDTLANFFVGSPNRRHLLSLVNEKVYGSTHHINKMEQELKKKQQLCTPEEAVKLVVDLRVPRRRYPILQKFITTFGQAFRHTTGVQLYPQLPSREKFSEAWTLLVGHMQLDQGVICQEQGAIGISWPLQKALDYIAGQPIFHKDLDHSLPLSLIVRGDAFPIAGTNWSQISITMANFGDMARNLSHTFIISIAYTGDKSATLLAKLWKRNIEVCTVKLNKLHSIC